MKPVGIAFPLAFVLLIASGCASTKVTERESKLGDEKLPRPERIIVYDFIASPADVPAESSIAGQYVQHSTPQTPEQIGDWSKTGRPDRARPGQRDSRNGPSRGACRRST